MAAIAIPDQFNEVFGLGSVVTIYPVKKGSKWGSAAAAVILLFLSVGVLVVGVWNALDVVRRNGPVLFWSSFIPFFLGSVFLFLLGIWAIWTAYANWKKAVVVYTNGLALSDRKGLKYLRWDEIDSIQSAVTKHYTNGVYSGTTHVYTLMKSDGTRLVLNDTIQKVEQLSDALRQNVFPLLYSKYSAAYNTGQSLRFGPVTISRQNGLTVGKKSYPWTEISKITVNQGILQVTKKGGGLFSGASAAASTIPNLEVLLSIVDQVIGVNLGK